MRRFLLRAQFRPPPLTYIFQIGINYKGQENELFGCVNDAKNVHRFLRRASLSPAVPAHLLTRFADRGYKDEDMVILTDDSPDPRKQPTRVNVLDAMHWLVRGARPHDSLFFHCALVSISVGSLYD